MTTLSQLDNSQHRSDIILHLHELYKRKECCDVTLCVTDPQSTDQVYIECHKVVFVAAIPYFKDVLLTGDDASNVNMIDLGTGKIDTVKEALNFIYSGRCTVSSENVVELLKFSFVWNLESLEKSISEVFVKHLSAENFVSAYDAVHMHNKGELEKDVSLFVRKSFPDIVDAGYLKSIPPPLMLSILKEDEFEVESEDVLFKNVLSWLESMSSKHVVVVKQICSLIRFQYLTPDFLVKEVLHHPLMQEEPQRNEVQSALLKLCNDDKVIGGPIARYWGDKPIYDRLAKITSDKKLYVYDDKKNKWKLGKKIIDWLDRGTQLCVANDVVVLVGADETKTCDNLSAIDMNTLACMTKSITAKKQVGTAKVDDYIYLIGGVSVGDNTVCDVVEKLNTKQSTSDWKKAQPLLEEVRSPLVFVHQHLIFVIGGCDKEDIGVTTNQVYDTQISEWSLRAAAPEDCYSYQNGGFIKDNQIHIFTEEHYMVYTIDTDCWSCVRHGETFYHVQPLLLGDRILACVRSTCVHDDDENKFVCKRYDLQKNQWIELDIDVADCIMHHLMFVFKSYYM